MARRRRRGSAKRSPARRARSASVDARGTSAPTAADRARDRRPDKSAQRRSANPQEPPRGGAVASGVRAGRSAATVARALAAHGQHGLVSAAMFSFGTTTALTYLLGELSYHTVDARQALFYGGTAICAGVAIGLWLPRQIVLRRLRGNVPDRFERASDESGPTRRGGANSASSLVAVLFLMTGVILLLLLLGAEAAESMRRFLTERFTFPLRLTRLLIWAPPLLGLTVAGACGTTALVALHGLRQLTSASRAHIDVLWLVIVTAVAVGALVSRLLHDNPGAILITLLPVALAGVATALRRRTTATTTPVPACAPTPAIATAVPAHPLFTVVVSAAAVGYAVVLALADCVAPPLPIENVLAPGGLAAATGVLLGQRIGRRFANHHVDLAAALFLLGLTWVLPYHWFDHGATVRLFAVTTIGVAGVVLAARRITVLCKSVQYVLAVVGVCVALGLTLSLVSAPLWIDLLPGPRIGLLLSLGIVAVVGILLLLDPRLPRRVRRPGLVAVGLWLLITPALAGRPETTPRDVESEIVDRAALDGAVTLGRGVLATRGFRTRIVRNPTDSTARGASTDWQIDLSPEKPDVLIVARGAARDRSVRQGLRIARRFLGRCLKTLRRGGRLVIEQPEMPLTRAAFGALRERDTVAPWNAYLLEISPVSGSRYSAVLFGSDVPSWIAGRVKPPDAEVALFPIEDFADLRAFVRSRQDAGSN